MRLLRKTVLFERRPKIRYDIVLAAERHFSEKFIRRPERDSENMLIFELKLENDPKEAQFHRIRKTQKVLQQIELQQTPITQHPNQQRFRGYFSKYPKWNKTARRHFLQHFQHLEFVVGVFEGKHRQRRQKKNRRVLRRQSGGGQLRK